jgi:hypothetical protein
MDKNPYGNVAASLLKKLEGHYQNGELRSFRDTYDEFSVVSGADNITLCEADAKPMMNKIKAICFAVPAVVAALVSLLLALIIPGWTTWLSVASGAASVGLSVLIAYLTHMHLMLDKKYLTYGILAGFGVVISVVLRVVIGLLL